MLAGCAAAARPKPRLIGLAVILVCAAAVTVCLGFLTGAVLGWAGSGFASVAMIFVSGARFCLRGFTSAAASLTSLLGATAGTGSGFASSGALLAICVGSGFGAGFTSDGGVSTFGSAAIAGLFSGAGGACTSAGEGFNSTGGVSTFAAGADFSSGSPMAIGDGSGCGAGFDCAGGVSTFGFAAFSGAGARADGAGPALGAASAGDPSLVLSRGEAGWARSWSLGSAGATSTAGDGEFQGRGVEAGAGVAAGPLVSTLMVCGLLLPGPGPTISTDCSAAAPSRMAPAASTNRASFGRSLWVTAAGVDCRTAN